MLGEDSIGRSAHPLVSRMAQVLSDYVPRSELS